LAPAEAMASIRFGVGRDTSAAEIDQAASQVVDAVTRVRALFEPDLGDARPA
jgi:cysteine sulfinate desulfinase/cysteine desulfurase-like protein